MSLFQSEWTVWMFHCEIIWFCRNAGFRLQFLYAKIDLFKCLKRGYVKINHAIKSERPFRNYLAANRFYFNERKVHYECWLLKQKFIVHWQRFAYIFLFLSCFQIHEIMYGDKMRNAMLAWDETRSNRLYSLIQYFILICTHLNFHVLI